MRRTALSALLCLFALPALAQPDDLLGTWTAAESDSGVAFTMHLALLAGGQLTFSAEAAVPPDTTYYPQGLALTFTGAGTWSGTADSLWVNLAQVDYRINGQTWDAFYGALIDQLVAQAIEDENVAEEDRAQFEVLVRQVLQTQLNPTALEQEITGPLLQETSGTHALAYSLQGDGLTTVDDQGEARTWQRGAGGSAVSAATWAQVKLAPR